MKSGQYEVKKPNAAGVIDYSDDENAVWADLYARQFPKLHRFMARDYLQGFQRLNMPADSIPQCAEITAVLRETTGWQVVPVPKLIPFERFFAMLAAREFPAASFIRNRQDFDYIQEPDIFHEVFGHAPLLCDARYADFSQAIGQAGLRAESKDYSWLIRLYWFSIEFGLIREYGQIRALGSGLASSPTELSHAVIGDAPIRRRFDVMDMLRTPYRIDIPQSVYFVIEDVNDLFRAAQTDLLGAVHKAQALGLFEPEFPPQKTAS